MSENVTDNYYKNLSFWAKVEKSSPLGYYFAIAIAGMMAIVYALVQYGGIVANKDLLMVTVSDAILIFGTTIFFLTSMFGYTKSKHLKIRDSMFAFSVSALSFLVAGLLWTWYNLAMQVKAPYSSLADVFYLVGSLALIAAMYSATNAMKSTTGMRADLSLITIFLAVIATAAIVGIYASFTDILKGGVMPITLVSIAYPVLDIVCLALVSNLIMISWGRSVFEAQMLIALGVVILGVSHIYFSITTSMGLYVYGPQAIMLYALACMIYAIGISRYVDLTKFDILMDRLSKLNNKQ